MELDLDVSRQARSRGRSPNASRRAALTLVHASGDDAVRQRWAEVFRSDHRQLSSLLTAFGEAQTAQRQTELLRLALDFHAMHQAYERAWVDVPQLETLDALIDDLALQLESMAPGTALYRARGLHWAELVKEGMIKEEQYHWDGLPWSRDDEPWSQELLRTRQQLIAQASGALAHAA